MIYTFIFAVITVFTLLLYRMFNDLSRKKMRFSIILVADLLLSGTDSIKVSIHIANIDHTVNNTSSTVEHGVFITILEAVQSGT